MAQDGTIWRQPKFWIIVVAIVILLIFLYYYSPFESYIREAVPNIQFSNIIFWFASFVGVAAFAISHWQSYKRNLLQNPNASQVDGLIFQTLQIVILTAVIFCAGAALQAVVMLGEHLVNRGAIITVAFGERLLSIVIFAILTILFYLLHLLVRALRLGWKPRRPHPRTEASQRTNPT